MFAATTTVTVLRTPDGAADAFGDDVDSDTPAATGLPGHISSTSRTHLEPASGQLTTVEIVTVRLLWPGGTLDAGTDRLRDERTGEIFSIDLVQPARYGGFAGDITAVSRRIT